MSGLLRCVLIAQRAQADVFAELTENAIQLATGDEDSQDTIAVDLDGTLAHHRHPFSHTSIGDPIDGAREAVEHLKKLAPRVVILTARPHLAAVREWVQRHNIPVDDVTNVKDHTMRLIIDDRGCHFNGDWPSTLKRAEARLKSHDAEELSTWNPDEHPRGQPHNPGEFAAKGDIERNLAHHPPRFLTGVSNAKMIERAKDHPHDIGVLVTPDTRSLAKHIEHYGAWAADNACFAHAGEFDTEKFMNFLDHCLKVPGAREKCLFAVAPDVFDPAIMRGDPKATIERSKPVFPLIRAKGIPAAMVAQDGLEGMIDQIPWDDFDVLFIGGGDDFKMGYPSDSVPPPPEPSLFPDAEDDGSGEKGWKQLNYLRLIMEARRHGKRVHIGRVNSFKRFLWSHLWGAHSVDGTYLGFGPEKNWPKLKKWIEKIKDMEADESKHRDSEELSTATAEPAEWVSYQGRRGGKGWRSAQTGRIVYQLDMPGSHQHVGAQQQELVPAEGKSEHAAYHAIKEGDLGYVQGFPVRRTGKDRWRLLEIAKGHVEGAPEDVQAHINEIKRHEANAKPMIDRALERAKSHTEPDFFREPDRVEKEAKAFDSLPHGAHVVSLEPHTRGRLGQIVRRVEDGRSVNRVKLHGLEGWAGNNVEPLDVHHSWRMPHEDKPEEKPPAPKMRQGFLFSTDGENWQPVYLDIPIVGGILKRGWDKIKSGYERLMERLRDEPEVPEEDLPEEGEIANYLRGEWLPVVSSNVASIRYLPDEQASEVEFLDKGNGIGFYKYQNVSPELARDFATAASKGKFIWDTFRQRGSVYGFNPAHPYSYVSSVSTYIPGWMKTQQSRLAHGKLGPLMSTEDMTGEEFSLALECWSAEEQQAADRWEVYIGPHGRAGRRQPVSGIIEYGDALTEYP